MSRRAWFIFGVWQLLGILFGSVSPFSRLRWALAVIGLLPGNILAGLAVERIFAQREMSLTLMSILEIPVMLLLNGVAWWSAACAISSFKRFRRRNTTGQVGASRQRAMVQPSGIPARICALAGIGLAVGGAVMISHRPVVIHLFGEWGCACGDFHERVTGIVVRNPLRDREPERVAGNFLDALKANRCDTNADLCAYALPRHRISDWRLVNREDAGDSVRLYFLLTKYGISNPALNLTGEGMVQLQKSKVGWQVTNYSSYF